nr:hypothetical protein [Streptomyces sp. NRRL S-474]
MCNSAADQPHGHRVAVRTDTDLRVSVHPETEQPACLERLVRQRLQQRAFDGEVLADRPGPRPDAAVVLGIPPLDHGVELGVLDRRPGLGPSAGHQHPAAGGQGEVKRSGSTQLVLPAVVCAEGHAQAHFGRRFPEVGDGPAGT